MTNDFLKSLRAEISVLEQELHNDPRYMKLRGLQDVLKLYDEESILKAESTGAKMLPVDSRRAAGRETHGRQPSEARVTAVNMSREFLRGKTVPTPTREIFAMLAEKGVDVGGKEPVSNLSAILSKSDGFRSIGRSGWVLVDEQEATEAQEDLDDEILESSGALDRVDDDDDIL